MRASGLIAVLLASTIAPTVAWAIEDASVREDALEEKGFVSHCSVAKPQTITDADTRLVLQTIIDPARAPNRVPMLEQYLARSVTSPNSVQQVAANHARLILAAERIKGGQYIEARQTLVKIDLSSTVAVDAALLMAESWRLQGDDAQALSWLIRIAQRYSSDPKALQGLLLSAQNLSIAGQVKEAWALYGLINNKVLSNVEQVSSIRQGSDALINDLLKTRLDESRSVTSQIIKTILYRPNQNALFNMREIIEAGQQLECLAKQNNSIKDEAWDESIAAANVVSFQTMLETEARINAHQRDALKAELVIVADSRERQALQAELVALEEHTASLTHRLNELKLQHQALPDNSLSQKKQLAQDIKTAQARMKRNREAVRLELDKALLALQNHYRELAAETQLARAELMQLIASN